MIVVDSNVLAYLLIPGVFTADARLVQQKDPVWVAPGLWRSELRNVLLGYLRRGALMLPDAVALMEAAEQRMAGGDVSVNSEDILRLADASGCTAYDSEFVAAAQQLGATLVTADRKILAAFPAVSMSIADFAAS